ncbi:MAG: hypothetical protein WBP44_03165 [Gammaproteobacteria bacterium]
MNEPVILYPAIFVFSMLLIGLLLTMWEFTRMQKKTRQQQERQHDEAVKPRAVNADTRKVSNF